MVPRKAALDPAAVVERLMAKSFAWCGIGREPQATVKTTRDGAYSGWRGEEDRLVIMFIASVSMEPTSATFAGSTSVLLVWPVPRTW